MAKLTEKFITYFRKSGLNRNAFAKKVGISPSTVDNYLQGDRVPSVEVISKLFEYDPDLSPMWFFKDEGEMLISETMKPEGEETQEEETQEEKPLEVETPSAVAEDNYNNICSRDYSTEFLLEQINKKDGLIMSLTQQIAEKDKVINKLLAMIK